MTFACPEIQYRLDSEWGKTVSGSGSPEFDSDCAAVFDSGPVCSFCGFGGGAEAGIGAESEVCAAAKYAVAAYTIKMPRLRILRFGHTISR
ncbi:MAG TPA: hypothetical protein VEI99_11215 [Terriglobales bacterium]|nr:hypothetical protein [Terriglobales bacterium]